MLLKFKKNWKDLINSGSGHDHAMSRRELIQRGLATGAMGVALHESIAGKLIAQAAAQTMNCPAPIRNMGAIGQIFAEGGPTMGARFISDAQAAAMSTGMAANYGITGTNLVRLGPNMNIDSTSPFGATLLEGPAGYPGGAAAWRTNVLSKISGGGHLGQFNQDDGAGDNTGLLAGVSPFKVSVMNKDIRINNNRALATWANGLPAASVRGGGSPATLASTFSLIPAAAGFTNSGAITAASDASNQLAKVMDPVFKNSERKLASTLTTNAGCAFYGNSSLADPNYGATLFNPANIAALNTKLTVGGLTQPEQAQLAAFYQSAMGVAGGVVIQFGGRDYHPGAPITDIPPADREDARAIVMFLAACDAAQAKGSIMYFSNGQAVADGTQPLQMTLNGANITVNTPVAQGDSGGSYNAGLIIFYDPAGAPPAAKFTGTVNSTSGNAQIDTNIPGSRDAVAGLYLSALKFVNGNISAAQQKMASNGVSSNPTKIMVI